MDTLDVAAAGFFGVVLFCVFGVFAPPRIGAHADRMQALYATLGSVAFTLALLAWRLTK